LATVVKRILDPNSIAYLDANFLVEVSTKMKSMGLRKPEVLMENLRWRLKLTFLHLAKAESYGSSLWLHNCRTITSEDLLAEKYYPQILDVAINPRVMEALFHIQRTIVLLNQS
jgi:hypothetical protein